MSALGLIETRGLVAAIEAADVMVKSSDVRLLDKTCVGAGLVTISVTGDVAAVKSSVESASAAITRINGGELVASHVIPRPEHCIKDTLFGVSSGSSSTPDSDPDSGSEPALDTVEEIAEEIADTIELPKKDDANRKDDAVANLSRIRNAASSKKKKPFFLAKEGIDTLARDLGAHKIVSALGRHTVTTLRDLARQYSEFPITEKELSKGKKRTILDGFIRYYNSLN